VDQVIFEADREKETKGIHHHKITASLKA